MIISNPSQHSLLRWHEQVSETHSLFQTQNIILWLSSILIVIGFFKILSFQVSEFRRQYAEIPSLIRPNQIIAAIIALIMTSFFLYIAVYLALSNSSLLSFISFALTAFFVGLSAFIYSDQSKQRLILAFSALLLSVFSSQWLFIQSFDFSDIYQQQIWKHLVRNSVGFNQFYLILACSQIFGQICLYDFKTGVNINGFCAICVYELVIIPFILGGLMIWNILAYGPFEDLIGYTSGCVLTYIITIFIKIVSIHCQIMRKQSIENVNQEQK